MANLNNTQIAAIRSAVDEQAGNQVDPTQLTINDVPGFDNPLIVNAENGRVYQLGQDAPIGNINANNRNAAPRAANTASAPRPYRGDAEIVRDIQRFAKFAQDGGLAALDGVKISPTIDGTPGGGTGRSMRAMSGLSYDDMKDMSQADFADRMDAQMQDPDFRDAVIKGLEAAGADDPQVKAFLEDRGVDSIEALTAKYDGTEAEATVEAPATEAEAVEIPRSDNPAELQSLVTALGQNIGKIDGIIGNGTKAGLEALGIDPTLDTADAIDALRDQVREGMTPESFEALVEKADNPKDLCALQATLRAMGHDVGLDGKMGPQTQGAIDAVRESMTTPAAAVETPEAAAEVETSEAEVTNEADPLAPTGLEQEEEAAAPDEDGETPDPATAFADNSGQSFMFTVDMETGDIAIVETVDKTLEELMADPEVDVTAEIKRAVENGLGIGEGGNGAFVQSEFDALWDKTEYWGSGNPDNIGEFAYNILDNIKSTIPSTSTLEQAQNFKISDIVDVRVSNRTDSPVRFIVSDSDLDSISFIDRAIKENPESLHAKIRGGVENLGMNPEQLQEFSSAITEYFDSNPALVAEGTAFGDMNILIKEAITAAVNELAPETAPVAALAQPGMRDGV